MLLVATIPALVALAGLLVFGLATGKVSQAGLAAFTAGLAIALLQVAHESVKIGS